MNWRWLLYWLLGGSCAVLLFLFVLQRTVTRPAMNFLFQSEIPESLARSMEDQKQLARLDPENSALYRQRFEELDLLRRNYQVLQINQTHLARNFETILVGGLIAILLLAAVLTFMESRRTHRFLLGLREQMAALAENRPEFPSLGAKRGLFRRIDELAREQWSNHKKVQKKVRDLEHLNGWQESARRHAHEIRTPLTAAFLEMESMQDRFARDLPPPLEEAWQEHRQHVITQLNRLKEFTNAFAAFGKLTQPTLKPQNLNAFLKQFAQLYHSAWSNLNLVLAPDLPDALCAFDSEHIRQVLVNLCQNASQAMGDRQGTISLSTRKEGLFWICRVADDGPGIPQAVLSRLFEPYVTTRSIGQGMGLGLAIAQKIMLDHGGDLILASSSAAGTCFELFFPCEEQS
ncbi:MAG: hypothetical protein KDC71_20590 [Acidobacteria bacterium]|nr:hypothetical protein [Acidobacteriota bacterium]